MRAKSKNQLLSSLSCVLYNPFSTNRHSVLSVRNGVYVSSSVVVSGEVGTIHSLAH